MNPPTSLPQPIAIYKDILGSSFNFIKKNLPKKYASLKELINQLQERMEHDSPQQLDAGRYFIVYKLAINMKQPKLTEACLKALQELISKNFLKGNSPDYTLEVTLEDFKELHDPTDLKNNLGQRTLQSAIVETVSSLVNEKDDQVSIQAIKVFGILACGILAELHAKHLAASILAIIQIYSNTRSAQVENEAKAVLQQIINYNFEKLSFIEGEKIKKQLFGGNTAATVAVSTRNNLVETTGGIGKERSPSPNQTNIPRVIPQSMRGDTTFLNQKELAPINNILKSQEDVQDADSNGDQEENVSNSIKSRAGNSLTFERICFDALQNVVDDLCINEARKQEIANGISGNSSISESQKAKYITVELDNLPQRAVPHELDPDDPKYQRVIAIQQTALTNEQDQPAGQFGWCSKCRKTANFYCKDLRVPICSYQCKKEYLSLNETINRRFFDYLKNSRVVFEDCLSVLSCLSQLLVTQPDSLISQQQSSLEVAKSVARLRTISLEMIYSIFDLNISTFFKREQTVKVIRNKLFDGLLKSCLNSEKSIFSLSFGVFLQILVFHKEEFKNEISVFINEIFLQLLESTNSTSNHRRLALQVLNKAFSKTRVVLDFYVNYDCSFNQVQLVDRIVSILSKIGSGLYSQPEFSMVIQPNQELSLRQYAIETLAAMMSSIYEYFENFTSQQEKQQQQQNQISSAAATAKNLDETTIISNDENMAIINNFQGAKTDLLEASNLIEQEHLVKIETQRAITKFNKKPSLGIKHLVQSGIIQPNDAQAIALFLRNNPSISKDQIGEYIGGHHEININVLSEFTDLLDFKGQRIDESIRYFLEQFTLPGESQIVDRILQKFGDKFESDNPQLFQSQGNAYTLSFLLIMLQTDMYNPQVKDKMKIEDFIKIAKGIEGENFENEYLTELYRSIQRKPLALHDKAKQAKSLQDSILVTVRKKQDLFQLETQQMIEKGKGLIQANGRLASKFVTVNSIYYIGPLIETIGSKVVAAFKQGFESCEDEKTGRCCLQGLISTIVLSCNFGIEHERDAFVETLCDISNISSFPAAFKKKNYLAIKNALHLTTKVPNNLQTSWLPILTLVSALNEHRLIQSGADKRGGLKRLGSVVLSEQDWTSVQTVYFESDFIDRIYSKSTQLDGESILSFVSALCKVSKEELTSIGQSPRIFSLQKIVEIAELNLDRVVIVWNRIWAIIRDHFSDIGSQKNMQVAIIAVDSLKQLSQKFFSREERFNLQFQRDFLRPFEIIFQQAPAENIGIKHFIFDCVRSFITNYSKKIKSGWRIIFNIIGLALQDGSKELSDNAHELLKKILDKNIDYMSDVFVDLVQCLTKLSKKDDEVLAISAVGLVKICLCYLAEKSHVVAKSKLEKEEKPSTEDVKIQNKKLMESYWVPLLGVLSNLCGDQRPEVQEKSMEQLFEMLTEYGYSFSIEFWKMIFQGVLRPLFDEIQFTFQTISQQHLQGQSTKLNWLKQSCTKAFDHITNLLDEYYEELQTLVIEFFRTYENCINNTNESLIRQSVTATKNSIFKLGPKFKKVDWDMVIEFFERMIRLTTPNKVYFLKVDEFVITLFKLQTVNVNSLGEKIAQDIKGKRKQSLLSFKAMKINYDDANSQSKAQLLLIKVIQDVINQFQDKLLPEQLNGFCGILEKSYSFAIEFNSLIFLRFCLWKTGFNSELKQLPGILRQERQAQALSLYIKYTLYRKQMKKGICDNFNDLLDKLVEYMTIFLRKHKDLQKIIEGEIETKKEQEKVQNISEEDELEQTIEKLKLTEVERDVNNNRTMMTETVLPILEKIELAHIKPRVKEIYCMLIDMTQFSQNRSFSQMVCSSCKKCSRCSILEEDLDIGIRKILKKLFKFICENPLPSEQQQQQQQVKAPENEKRNSLKIDSNIQPISNGDLDEEENHYQISKSLTKQVADEYAEEEEDRNNSKNINNNNSNTPSAHNTNSDQTSPDARQKDQQDSK